MSNLLFCLQVCPLDCDAGLELTKLIVELEQQHPSSDRPPWLISYRKDTPLSRVATMQEFLLKAFPTVWSVQAEHFDTGWPSGSNALWRSAMQDVARAAASGELDAEGVLTFEPDCVPCTEDWITRLQRAYAERTKPIVGNIHDQSAQGGIAAHVNGNGIFPVWLARDWKAVLSTPKDAAWDYHHRELLVPVCQDTNLITSWYHKTALTDEEWKSISKNGVRPALLHGVKDSSARAMVKRYLLHGGRLGAPTPGVFGTRAFIPRPAQGNV